MCTSQAANSSDSEDSRSDPEALSDWSLSRLMKRHLKFFLRATLMKWMYSGESEGESKFDINFHY